MQALKPRSSPRSLPLPSPISTSNYRDKSCPLSHYAGDTGQHTCCPYDHPPQVCILSAAMPRLKCRTGKIPSLQSSNIHLITKNFDEWMTALSQKPTAKSQ